MDIKNILNTAERRSFQANSVDPETTPTDHPMHPKSSPSNPPQTPPTPPIEPPDPRLPHLPSSSTPHLDLMHPPSPLPSSQILPPQPPSQMPPPPPPQQPQPPPPPPLPQPPQQIVYTGPVYQLRPNVEVRHLGSTIHYRYTPYPTYDDLPHVDYAVYQEYSELPRHPSTRPRSHDSYCDRPPSPSRPAAPTPSLRPLDRHSSPLHHPPPVAPSRSRSRPRHQFYHTPVNTHPSQSAGGPQPFPRHYRRPPKSDDNQPRESRSPTSYQHCYQPRYHPSHPSYSKQGVAASYPRTPPSPTVPAVDRFERQSGCQQPLHANNHPPDSFRRYAGYVSYHGPGHTSLDVYQTHPNPSHNLTTYPAHPNTPPPPHCEIRAKSPSNYSTMDHSRQSRSRLHLSDQFSPPHDIPSNSNGRHQKKRERLNSPPHSRRSPSPCAATNMPHPDHVAHVDAESSKHLTPYNPNFLRACSVERDSKSDCDPPPPHLSTLRVPKKLKHSRMRDSSRPTTTVSAHRNTNRTQIWASNSGASRKKNRVKEESHAKSKPRKPCVSVKSEKTVSPLSAEDDCSAPDVDTTEKKEMPLAKRTPWGRKDVIIIDYDTPTMSDREEAVSSRDNDIAQSVDESEAWSEQADQLPIPAEDPELPYPETSSDFSGIPVSAVGDLLQLWEFVSSFYKTLRLSPFKLRHLEQAIAHKDRSSLLDACVTRLVQSILTDAGLVDELGVPDSLVKKLMSKGASNQANAILAALPDILSFESDEVEDLYLDEAVQRIAGSSNKWAFYQILEPSEKLRVLRELVDYASMADTLRECVVDSLEHAEEERRRAREENVANRKKLETQIREHKQELLEYRLKHKLLETPADSDKEKGPQDPKSSTGIAKEPQPPLSRKQKLMAARKEKKDEEERRVIERGEDAIIAKIDRDKASLKALKNLRLRNKSTTSAREGESFEDSAGAPNIPFAAPHEDPVRTRPLGTDRNERCYWFFEGCGRLWIEDTKKREWCAVKDAKNLDTLSRWLSQNRQEERHLAKNLRARRDIIVAEMAREAKEMEMAKTEAEEVQDSMLESSPCTTRARKRKAEIKVQKARAKRNKNALHFEDYRNLEK